MLDAIVRMLARLPVRTRASRMRTQLNRLAGVLSAQGEEELALTVRSVVSSDDQKLEAFLVSNELWGGAGSIADQAGVTRGRESRRAIEAALIALGRAQVGSGRVNPRTLMWIEAFRKLQREGI